MSNGHAKPRAKHVGGGKMGHLRPKNVRELREFGTKMDSLGRGLDCCSGDKQGVKNYVTFGQKCALIWH